MIKTKIGIVCLVLMTCLFSFTGKCQLAPPKQIDTLVITEMFYNKDIVDKTNWPFVYVIKTPSSFTFGNQVIDVEYDYEYDGIVYKDKRGNQLRYKNNSDGISISYSGYLLKCTPLRAVNKSVIKDRNSDDIEIEDYAEWLEKEDRIEEEEIP